MREKAPCSQKGKGDFSFKIVGSISSEKGTTSSQRKRISPCKGAAEESAQAMQRNKEGGVGEHAVEESLLRKRVVSYSFLPEKHLPGGRGGGVRGERRRYWDGGG